MNPPLLEEELSFYDENKKIASSTSTRTGIFSSRGER